MKKIFASLLFIHSVIAIEQKNPIQMAMHSLKESANKAFGSVFGSSDTANHCEDSINS